MIYEVYISPLISPNKFGEEVRATDYLASNGLGNIEATIDNSDFAVGVFSYTFMGIKFLNYDNTLSAPEFSESIFSYKRDGSQVRVVFGNYEFTGLISEASSKADDDTLDIKIISLESIIDKTSVPFGVFSDGIMASRAIEIILNRPIITNILNIESFNINLDLDFPIDNVIELFGLSSREAINTILALANSFLYVDVDRNIIIKSRTELGIIANQFFSSHDKLSREPTVLSIKNYNDGTQRAFNSFSIDNIREQDNDFIQEYGFRDKTISAPFLLSDPTKRTIANNLVEKYRVPKVEFEAYVKTVDIENLGLGDMVRVSYSQLVGPPAGQETTAKYAIAKYGQKRYSRTAGSITINADRAWIIYGRRDIPERFISVLKLREFGFQFDDGIVESSSAVYGFAKYGRFKYNKDNNPINYSKGIYGLSKYGTKRYEMEV